MVQEPWQTCPDVRVLSSKHRFIATGERAPRIEQHWGVLQHNDYYFHGKKQLEAPTMWTTLAEPRLGKKWRFRVHAERFDIEEFANVSDDEIAAWLGDRSMEKSNRLKE